MAGANLAFSKIVATPTPTAWSQAYSAGSLFAAISLRTDTPPLSDADSLGSLGKDLISTLESEFFTLENKDLESIKQAIATTFGRIKDGVNTSFIVCFLNENILYLYASGGGKAVLKRGEKIGTVLEGEDANIKSASGYVQSKDIIILQTKPFQRIIQSATLASSLDKNTPSEITEELAPHVHDKSEGGASAIILSYNEGIISESEAAGIAAATAATAANVDSDSETQPQVNEELSETIDETSSNIESMQEPPVDPLSSEVNNEKESIGEIKDSPTPPLSESSSPYENPPPKNMGNETENLSPFPNEQKPKKKFSLGLKKLPRGRRLILLIGIILVIIIFLASVFALLNMRNANNEELFNAVYNEAKAKYEEGQSLMELNESLAMENLKQAQAILLKNKDTFPEGSSEDDQIEALLSDVNNALGSDTSSNGGNTSTSQATEVEKSQSQFLSIQIDNPDSEYFAQNEDFVYFINAKGVSRVDKGNSEEEAIIDKDWKEEGGIGVFGSNIYVLDKSENIFKFVPSGSDFTKSDYLSGTPDLESSTAMTIDGSIYVLDTNGEIKKFTKGAEEDFSVTGLEKPMSSPTRISTTEDGSNIYVLDNGNSRIVVLDKDGKFVKAYSADILKAARDIDPQEANNAIFVLSGNKVYKISTN